MKLDSLATAIHILPGCEAECQWYEGWDLMAKVKGLPEIIA